LITSAQDAAWYPLVREWLSSLDAFEAEIIRNTIRKNNITALADLASAK
jgi:hypothetical protein